MLLTALQYISTTGPTGCTVDLHHNISVQQDQQDVLLTVHYNTPVQQDQQDVLLTVHRNISVQQDQQDALLAVHCNNQYNRTNRRFC
jgi:hypothetical protein